MKRTHLILGILLTLSGIVAAQTSAPNTTQPADPQAEIARLRAENAALKSQIEELQQRLSAASAPATRTATTRPKTFTTMMDILAKCPEELRPKPDPDWYKYTESKYCDWVSAQMIGLIVDTKLPFDGCQVYTSVGGTKPEDRWTVLPNSFAPQGFTYFGEDHNWSIQFPRFNTSEEIARRWDKIKKGTILPVKGVITSVNLHEVYNSTRKTKLPKYHLTITLRDLTVPLPN